MNPRAAAATKQKTEPKTSPFEHIAEREAQEEQRLQDALEQLRAEEIQMEKTIVETEKDAEEKLLNEARKELAACKENISKELASTGKEIEKEIHAIETKATKNSAKAAEDQVAAFLSSVI